MKGKQEHPLLFHTLVKVLHETSLERILSQYDWALGHLVFFFHTEKFPNFCYMIYPDTILHGILNSIIVC